MKQPLSLHPASSKPLAAGAALLGAALLAAGGALALNEPNAPDKPAAPAPEFKVEHAPVNRERTPAGSFAPIVQKVAPSVVEVFVTAKAQRGQDGGDMERFRRFFGVPGGGEDSEDSPTPSQHGLGSGVIVSADGYILTNNHVVKDASDIRVALADGRRLTGKVVGTDQKTDVALVKIQATGLPALTFADSNELAVGDVVLAVGNPFGLSQTVTQGIVSAKDRVTNGAMDEDFIQTDAAINPGNSGGALVDVEGRLVGINTAIFSRSGGNQGIGFAIPSNLCQWVMTSLAKNGRVERGFLGVTIQTITPELAEQFKLDRMDGALVADVTADGPAAAAGLKSGDVIQKFNGQPVKDSSQFKLQVAETAPGSKVSVQVLRDGQARTLDAAVRAFPADKLAANSRRAQTDEKRGDALSGVAVADLSRQTRERANVPDNVQGALITAVRPNSPAAEAGLKPGNVITEINRQPVKNSADAVRLTDKPSGPQTLVKVWSEEGTRFLTVDESSAG